VFKGEEPFYVPEGLDATSEISEIAFSPSGKLMVVLDEHGATLYEIPSETLSTVKLKRELPDTATVAKLAFLDENLLVVLHDDGSLEALPLAEDSAQPWPSLSVVDTGDQNIWDGDYTIAVESKNGWIALVSRSDGELSVVDGRLGVRVIDPFKLPYKRLPWKALPKLSGDLSGNLTLHWGEVSWHRPVGSLPQQMGLATGFRSDIPDTPISNLSELFRSIPD
jgi:hypothetical protein